VNNIVLYVTMFPTSLLCFRIVINLTNFFVLPGIRTRTDHLQATGRSRCPCVSSLFKTSSRKHQKLN